MLDIVNDELTERGETPIAFDSDCREGICGACALTINGQAHGPRHPSAACQIYMRQFRDRETITIEPFRAKSFPLVLLHSARLLVMVQEQVRLRPLLHLPQSLRQEARPPLHDAGAREL